MATRLLNRSRLTTTTQSLISSFSRSISSASLSTPPYLSLRRLSPLAANFRQLLSPASGTNFQLLTTRRLSSSLNDPNPNSPDRYFNKTLAHGCDFKHWRVIIDKPEGINPSRNELIDHYIKTLAKVIGSEEEARMKIYSVYTKEGNYVFGALVSKEVSKKLTDLENVLLVVPDSYKDVQNKIYGGEPFINGEAVPYDPKYYEHRERPVLRTGPAKTEVCLVNLETVWKIGGPYSFN